MPELVIPFAQEAIHYRPAKKGTPFLPGFPQELREAAQEKAYLAAYLNALPVNEIGIPAYYPKLERSLGKLARRNLIYPVKNGIFVHIYPDELSERDFYIVIEPTLGIHLNGLERDIELKLLEMAEEIGQAEADDRGQVFLDSLDKILTAERPSHKRKSKKIHVTKAELEAIRYTTLRDKVGVGALDPLLGDPSNDGFVGIADLNLVLGNWNAGTPPGGSAVPEPGTLSVLGLCVLAAVRRR